MSASEEVMEKEEGLVGGRDAMSKLDEVTEKKGKEGSVAGHEGW